MTTAVRVWDDAIGWLSSGSWHAIDFYEERYDYGGMHSTASNQSRLVAPTKGIYVISGCFAWDANATGLRGIGIRLNGSDFIAIHEAPNIGASFDHFLSIATQWELNQNDYVELVVFQNSGGNLQQSAYLKAAPEFQAVLVSAT